MARFVVLKFGGTSVASRARWEVIAQQAQRVNSEGATPVIVCSAVSGVTSALEALLDAAEADEDIDGVARIAQVHADLAAELGVSASGIDHELGLLRRLATGARLLGEVGPRVRARVMALGEKMSTRLGVAFLQAQGLGATWLDATTALTAVERPGAPEGRRWLQADVAHDPDPALVARLSEASVVITQGFIARGARGDTVLLGRGGSDTSAAIFAARLGAERCEIWTDVPGMFTANPRQISGARLLKRLDYDEAQEIATTGAKVLHPRCLAPVRDAGIPLEIRCTTEPSWPSTLVDQGDPSRGPMVQAISARRGIVLVSMETVGMWQQVGFLADIFAVYKQLGLSVDSVSTSETNVTVTLDPAANPVDGQTLERLTEALSPYCEATCVPRCASVSLVGRGIRAILHQLSPAFQLFEEHKVHLVTQAASDLNLTVVVDADQADRLVDRLHALLFAHRGASDGLGPSWTDLQGTRAAPAKPADVWWRSRRSELQALRDQTPVYVYNADHIQGQAQGLRGVGSLDRVLYAMKANPHPEVLRMVHAQGLGFETVSQGEVERVLREVPGVDPSEILFTPNFCDRETVAWALETGVRLTVDNLHPLVHWPDLFAAKEIFLRLDPGKGRGHHDKVRTAGSRSKFGISMEQLDDALSAVERAGATVVGLHAHAGSGVLEVSSWQDTAVWLAGVAASIPTVRVLDLGGGLGVPGRPGDPGLDLGALDQALAAVKQAHPDLQLWMEPGRYLVADGGVLLVRVTQRKRKLDRHYVGVDAGMNALIRPALYGAWHPIENLDRPAGEDRLVADVVGPICESGDVLGRDRSLPADTAEGDLIAIAQAGAYGASMASAYNDRPLPAECVLGPTPAGHSR